MADQNVIEGRENKEPAAKQDCGLFNFFGKKGEKHQEGDAIMAENAQVSVPQLPHEKKEDTKHTLDEELHRSHGSSSTSSDEEGSGENKKRKKKGIKDKIKEKIAGHGEDCPVEQKETIMHAEAAATPEEKKGFTEKTKEKIPGKEKNGKEHIIPAPTPPECDPGSDGTGFVDGEPKKGILGKIKDKLPGHHKNGEEVKKEN